MTGVISERDYISKIALLGRTSKETRVKEIATQSAKVVTVGIKEPVEICMQKMLNSDIRHVSLFVGQCALAHKRPLELTDSLSFLLF
jgi:hypothetical protein